MLFQGAAGSDIISYISAMYQWQYARWKFDSGIQDKTNIVKNSDFSGYTIEEDIRFKLVNITNLNILKRLALIHYI
jgi:hypothetical protein